jgi:plastocyanin
MPLARRIAVFASLASVFAVATPLLAADYTVTMGPASFSPASLTIDAGDRVRWRNLSPVQHTATSGTNCEPDGLWDTGFMNPNAISAYYTFNTPGTYPYFCMIHCLLGMTGEIIVKQPPVPVQNKTWGAIKALYKTSNLP